MSLVVAWISIDKIKDVKTFLPYISERIAVYHGVKMRKLMMSDLN